MLIDHAIAAAGVSRRTLYYWMAQGRLPYTVVRGHRRVLESDVQRVASRADLAAAAFEAQAPAVEAGA